MVRSIGFAEIRERWNSSVVLEFELVSEHTKTARYRTRVETRQFDLYLPLFMLPDQARPPQRIVVALGKSLGPLRTIGFTGETIPPETTSDIAEFEFESTMANSVKYHMRHNDQAYGLYVPNEVFAGSEHPRRVYLQVGTTPE